MELHVALTIAAAGLVAGIFNGVVGGASLVMFPILVALGIPPTGAVMTNIIGLGLGNAFSVLAHVRSRRAMLLRWRRAAVITCAGALVGAVLLRATPEHLFNLLVPVLVAFATLTMLLPKPEAKWQQHGHPHTQVRLWFTGIYGGYFNAGIGVIAMAVLARDGRLDMREVAIIKNLVVSVASVVTAAFFLATGGVPLVPAATLFVAAGTGGYIGGRVIDRLDPVLLRKLVIAMGAASTVYLTLRLL